MSTQHFLQSASPLYASLQGPSRKEPLPLPRCSAYWLSEDAVMCRLSHAAARRATTTTRQRDDCCIYIRYGRARACVYCVPIYKSCACAPYVSYSYALQPHATTPGCMSLYVYSAACLTDRRGGRRRADARGACMRAIGDRRDRCARCAACVARGRLINCDT